MPSGSECVSKFQSIVQFARENCHELALARNSRVDKIMLIAYSQDRASTYADDEIRATMRRRGKHPACAAGVDWNRAGENGSNGSHLTSKAREQGSEKLSLRLWILRLQCESAKRHPDSPPPFAFLQRDN